MKKCQFKSIYKKLLNSINKQQQKIKKLFNQIVDKIIINKKTFNLVNT